jgi:hypothetical protein
MFGTWLRRLIGSSSERRVERPAAPRIQPRVETLEARDVPSASPTALLNGAYEALLHRPVDQGGLNYWGGLVATGELTQQQVLVGIEATTEYRTVVIQTAYQQLLHRQVDTAALNFWLNSSLTGEEIRESIMGSAEFFANAGGTTSGFLTAIYTIGLGRQPDAGGLATFTAFVNGSVQSTRIAAAHEIFTSQEAVENEVTNFYEGILDRAPDTPGHTMYVNEIQTGTSVVTVINTILLSTEFSTLLVTNTTFIADATINTALHTPG